jgi:hypothetical protein
VLPLLCKKDIWLLLFKNFLLDSSIIIAGYIRLYPNILQNGTKAPVDQKRERERDGYAARSMD